MADGTKRTSRDLGAASPEQKPARPTSEVVGELLQRRGGDPRTPSCSPREKGEVTQVPPRCAKTQWRRGARRLPRSCCGNCRTRAGSSFSRIFPQQSFRLGLATLAQRLVDYSLFTPSGCGCRCAIPFLRRVRCRSGSQTKKQRLFPYCSLFSTCCVFFHATHFFASPRSSGIGGLHETVKHLAVSPWPSGMGLRSGLTVYFEEEIEAFVFLFLQRSSSSTGSLKRSLRCTPAYLLDFLSHLSTDATLFQSAPDPSGSKGEMAMVAPFCHPLCGTACAAGLI